MTGITYKAWAHPSPAAAFLLIHGLGGNPSWWDPLSLALTKSGYSAYAIDLRNLKSFSHFSRDILKLRELIKKEIGPKKIFVTGESMGAIIALSMIIKESALFDGIICISPAFKSRAKLDLMKYLGIFLPLFYNPGKVCDLHFTADMCTRDINFIKTIEADYRKDSLSTSRILFDIFVAQTQMRLLKSGIDMPVLFLLAGEDKLVEPDESKKFFGRLQCRDKTIIEYPEMYHSLSIEVGKEKVFKDILDWAKGRI